MILSKIRATVNALFAIAILGSIGVVIGGFGLILLIDFFTTIFVETKSSSLIDPMVVWLSIFIALPIIYCCGYVLIICYKTFFVDVKDDVLNSSSFTSKIGLSFLVGFLGISFSVQLIAPVLEQVLSVVSNNVSQAYFISGGLLIFVIYINILDYYFTQQSTSPSISET